MEQTLLKETLPTSAYFHNSYSLPVYDSLPATAESSWILDRVKGTDRNISSDCLGYVHEGGEASYLFFIPVEWLDSAGYSEADLLRWLDVCRLPKTMDFVYRYYGTISLFPHLKPHRDTGYGYSSRIVPVVPKYFGYEQDLFYVVGCDCYDRATFDRYLQVILLRYIWCCYYTDIPYTVFRLLDQTPATRKQALLLAHLRRTYYSYYSIVTQPGDGIYENENAENVPLDPFRRWTSGLISNLRGYFPSSGRMVQAFHTYLTNPNIDLTTTRSFFTNGDYAGLYQYVKEKTL